MKLNKAAQALGIVILVPVLTLFVAGIGRAEEAKRIDLSALVKYVKDWAAREAFPDSPSFAYQNAYCQLALEGRINDSDRNRIAEFLKKCQKPDGGFVSSPGLDENSNVIFTYFALAALDLIDAPSVVDREKAVDFILSLVQKDGGIKGTVRDTEANLGTTFYGVRSLYLLKALDRIEKSRTISYVNSHRDAGKGFGLKAGRPSTLQSTFMAVNILKVLGSLSDDLEHGVMEYLKDTPYSGIEKPSNPGIMNMADAAAALETASIFSKVQQMNIEWVHQFVESLYIPETGGFGPSLGLGATPPSTYSGIVCLVKLGKLKDPYSKK